MIVGLDAGEEVHSMSVGDEGFTFAHCKVCKIISFTPCMRGLNSEPWYGVYVGIHLTLILFCSLYPFVVVAYGLLRWRVVYQNVMIL